MVKDVHECEAFLCFDKNIANKDTIQLDNSTNEQLRKTRLGNSKRTKCLVGVEIDTVGRAREEKLKRSEI